MKRLTVSNVHVNMCNVLCIAIRTIRSMYNISEKRAEGGCFFNTPFQRLIPKSNE